MSNPLDTKVISRLAEILDKSNLTELEYEDEGCRICLSRQVNVVPAPAHAPLPPVPPAPAPVPAAAPAAPAPAAEEDYSKHPGSVKSPMVGVVYLSSDPNSPNYVKVGDTVAEGDTVCLIEAMKMISEIPSPCDCIIQQVVAEDGQLVGFGDALFEVQEL